jgi:hypothetical protein
MVSTRTLHNARRFGVELTSELILAIEAFRVPEEG